MTKEEERNVYAETWKARMWKAYIKDGNGKLQAMPAWKHKVCVYIHACNSAGNVAFNNVSSLTS